jgi:hypothetical protein
MVLLEILNLKYLEKQMLITRASTRHLPLQLIINMYYYLILHSSSGSTTSRRALIVRSVVATNTSGIQVALEPRDDTFITEYNSSGSTGFPKYYATFRENAIEVAPTPSSNFVVELDYIYTPDGFKCNKYRNLFQLMHQNYYYMLV